MIRSKIISTKLVPEGNILAITLFGLVFCRDKRRVTPRVYNHELIHCKQQLEWLYLPFFVLYLIEWMWLWFKYRNLDLAYRNISFEREAYDNDHNFNYLKTRKAYANYR